MAILVDINGTVAIEGKPVRRIVNYLKTVDEDIYFISGSHESLRKRYKSLLEGLGLSYVDILLNPIDDTKDYAFKLSMARSIPNLSFAIDNNKNVLSLYRSVGIDAVHPNDIW